MYYLGEITFFKNINAEVEENVGVRGKLFGVISLSEAIFCLVVAIMDISCLFIM